MGAKRKHHTPAFKAQVAWAALQGDRTAHELAGPYRVHPTLIHAWKKQLPSGAEAVFAHGVQADASDAAARPAELFEQSRRLKMELEGLNKKAPPSLEQLRPLLEAGPPPLRVRHPGELPGLNRSSLSYQPVPETAENLRRRRLRGREAIYPKPKRSAAGSGHRRYP